MPLGPGVKYRSKGHMRFAIRDGKVIEVAKFQGKGKGYEVLEHIANRNFSRRRGKHKKSSDDT